MMIPIRAARWLSAQLNTEILSAVYRVERKQYFVSILGHFVIVVL